MKPLVSILIPAYNAEEWIADTIRSALSQTWPHKEIIVVDDGSHDKTEKIARLFEANGVIVVTQPNQGASTARNNAISLSKGDYIQWLDADDLLSPDKIENQIAELEKGANSKTLLSSSWAYFAYRVERAHREPTSLWQNLSPIDWLIHKMGENLHMQTATWLVSRELTEAAGPWDTELLSDDDGEYFCRVILASNGVRFTSKGLVYYRITDPGRLSYIGRSDKKKNSQLRSMQLHLQYIRSLEDSIRVHKACVYYLQTWSIHFYPERPDLIEETRKMAAELGGQIEIPPLRWKYSWITPVLGYKAAKRAQMTAPQIKVLVVRAWDKALYRLRGSSNAP